MFKRKQNILLLEKVSPESLLEYRLSGKPGIVVKIKDTLFLVKLPSNSALLEKHLSTSLCETCECICKWCPKVTDLTLSIKLGVGYDFADAVHRYGRIEKYDFITSAVEVFGKTSSECVVLECSNYFYRNPEDYEEQYFAETI